MASEEGPSQRGRGSKRLRGDPTSEPPAPPRRGTRKPGRPPGRPPKAAAAAPAAPTPRGAPATQAQTPAPAAPPRVELPLLDPRAPEPLSAEGAAALAARVDPAAHDALLRAIAADDALAELASRRGLLARFRVRGGPSAGVAVEAPEFATVPYLRRRVVKARLKLGEYLAPSAFELKRVEHGGASGGAAVTPMPAAAPGGAGETLLFSLGFRAGGSYEIMLAARPGRAEGDREAQAAIEGAARGARAPGTGSRAVDAGHARGRALLAPRGRGAPARAAPAAAAAGGAGGAGLFGLYGSIAGEAGAGGDGDTGASLDARAPARRKAGRWSADEVAALIDGVAGKGSSWAAIHALFCQPGGRISPLRSQVDLKDKWRNLVRAATDAAGAGAARASLPEDLRARVLQLAFREGGAPPPAPAAGYGSTLGQVAAPGLALAATLGDAGAEVQQATAGGAASHIDEAAAGPM
jgi:hypothetical protein